MSVIPDPAITDWVPLQGRPSGMAYFGQFQIGHTYQDGDCVIGGDGILYACVTDGTTTAPAAWPGAAGPQGVAGPQGPQGVGIPMPVVNGQWIKGVSGAAVWAPFTPADVIGAGLVAADIAWHNVGAAGEPPYQNGYSTYTAPFPGARFRKLASGQVELQAMVRPGTAGAAIFTLPAGYRPAAQLLFACASGEPTANGRFDGRCDLTTNGQVVPDSRNNQAWLSLQTTFFAEA